MPATQPALLDFIQQQSAINKLILEQLQGLRDKSDLHNGDSGVVQMPGGSGMGIVQGEKVKIVQLNDNDISSDSDSSDVESDPEERARKDIKEANSMIQAHFTKHKGKLKSCKKIEQEIKANRPFGFLDRDRQRHVIRDNLHPEELPFLYHLEGLISMSSCKCTEVEIKGMIDHIYQLVRDAQVHNWISMQKWSNHVVVRTAVAGYR